MKRTIPIVLGVLALAAGALAQTDADMIARALAAAPAQQKENATVVKWKPDYTYDTIKKGTNRLVCYDRSGSLDARRSRCSAPASATWSGSLRTGSLRPCSTRSRDRRLSTPRKPTALASSPNTERCGIR